MIWIATLCLLAVAAWLFFNALNEKRWVEAHSHDETVAADRGILPDISKYTASLRSDPGGKLSIDQEDTRFARTVTKVREKSAKASDWVEEQVTKARGRDDGETIFGKAVTVIGGAANRFDDKLDARAKRAAREGQDENASSGKAGTDEGFVARTMARVEEKLGTRTMQTRPKDERGEG